MKKIVFLAVVLTFLASSGFATELGSVLTSTKLSNQVSGDYFSNLTGTNSTAYVLSTGHKQGNKVYASGSFTTAIFSKKLTQTFDSSLLLGGGPNTWDSASMVDSFFTGKSFSAL